MRAPLQERDRERAPKTLLAVDGDGSAVQCDELLCQREPDARPGLRDGRPRAMESIEDETEIGRRDSGAAVANRDARRGLVAADGDADGATVERELEGVGEEVR